MGSNHGGLVFMSSLSYREASWSRKTWQTAELVQMKAGQQLLQVICRLLS